MTWGDINGQHKNSCFQQLKWSLEFLLTLWDFLSTQLQGFCLCSTCGKRYKVFWVVCAALKVPFHLILIVGALFGITFSTKSAGLQKTTLSFDEILFVFKEWFLWPFEIQSKWDKVLHNISFISAVWLFICITSNSPIEWMFTDTKPSRTTSQIMGTWIHCQYRIILYIHDLTWCQSFN